MRPVTRARNTIRIGLVLIAICLLLSTQLIRAQGGETGAERIRRAQPEPAQVEADEASTLEVVIEGIDGRLLDNVKAFLHIDKLDGEKAPSEARLHWLHDQAEEDIRTALQPFGYYQPEIDTSLEKTGGGWIARYRIQPGPPLKITRLDVQVQGEGNNDPAFQRILANLPLQEGQVLEHPRYEDIKQALQRVAAERGYFDARLKTSEIRVDLKAYTANVIVHFDTGRRYHFGEVAFQQEVLSPKFLHRFEDIEPGDPYRAQSLLKLQSDLINSEYFEQVQVSAPPERAEDQTIPVEVALEPREKYKFLFGVGFGTDTGARGRIGVENRRVNRWGHRYNVNLLASQVKNTLVGQYIIPGSDPRTDSFALRATLIDENSDTKDSQTATIGISKQRQEGLWLKIMALDYQWEQFSFGGEEETSLLLIPSLNWTRVDAENRLNVTEGSRLNLELRGAHEALLSDVSFLQGVVRGKYIRPLGEDGRLIVRGDVGSSLISEFDALPSSVRFFAGGDNSVRGFDLDTIGPRNQEGDVIGGKHLLVGSLEYEHRIKDKWSVAAFVDSGDAFDDETPDFKSGVGAGVRWQSPVGPVRVDLAHGLEEPGDTIRLHLTIGPDL